MVETSGVGGGSSGEAPQTFRPAQTAEFNGHTVKTGVTGEQLDAYVPADSFHAGGAVDFKAENIKSEKGKWPSAIQKIINFISAFFASFRKSESEFNIGDLYDKAHRGPTVEDAKQALEAVSSEKYNLEESGVLTQKLADAKMRLEKGDPRPLFALIHLLHAREQALSTMDQKSEWAKILQAKKEILNDCLQSAQKTVETSSVHAWKAVEETLPHTTLDGIAKQLDLKETELPKTYSAKAGVILSELKERSAPLKRQDEEYATQINELEKAESENLANKETAILKMKNLKQAEEFWKKDVENLNKEKEEFMQQGIELLKSSLDRKLVAQDQLKNDIIRLKQENEKGNKKLIQSKTKEKDQLEKEIKAITSKMEKYYENETQVKKDMEITKGHEERAASLKTKKNSIFSELATEEENLKGIEKRLADIQVKKLEAIEKKGDLHEKLQKLEVAIQKLNNAATTPLADSYKQQLLNEFLRFFVLQKFLSYVKEHPADDMGKEWGNYITSHREELKEAFSKELESRHITPPITFSISQNIVNLIVFQG